MKNAKTIAGTFLPIILFGLAGTSVPGCSKSESGGGSGSSFPSGISGIYTSVDNDAVRIELKSGVAVISMDGQASAHGTYTVDGEKIIVDISGDKTIFVRDGACIDDYTHSLGMMCKGGKSGAAANVFKVPATTGTYAATNADGEFMIEFKPGNKFTLSIKPVVGNSETQEATFAVEADTIYATLPLSVPMVLQFVNDTYESTSFGLPMRFVKQ